MNGIWNTAGRTIVCITAVALVAGCATIRTGQHRDETNDFGRYETFAWIDDSPYIREEGDGLSVDPLTQSKIEAAIRSTLESRGYRYLDDPSSADFVIAYTVGSREHVTVDSYPVMFRGAWGWHVRGGYFYVYDRNVHTYTRGTLAVDVFDGETQKPVWHGWAEKTVTAEDRRDPTDAINEGVAALFDGFPR